MVASLRRTLPLSAKVGIALAGAWAGWVAGIPRLFHLVRWLVDRVAHRGFHTQWIFDLLQVTQFILEATLFPLLVGATLAVAVGALGRMVARARVRAGNADPLERARTWMSRHAAAARAVVWAPAALWLAQYTLLVARSAWRWGGWAMYGEHARTADVVRMHMQFTVGMAVFWCLSAPLALGIRAATRAALGALLAPTVGQQQGTQDASVDERLHFDAVAVTAETRAAVLAVAVLPVLTVLGIGAARLGDGATMAALAGYAAVALGSVVAFRRASRVAVGVDGVFVTGSSRTRFFAYTNVDEVRARTGELELVRHGKVVLRLQLHGKDAECRDALLLRLQDAIRTAHDRAGAAAAEVVASVSSADLARAAAGASDYRSPAVTRDQLWGVVEGTEHDATTRTAAARALATTHSVQERGRLRVAAERCAEPQLRVELLELAEDSDDEIAVTPLASARLAR